MPNREKVLECARKLIEVACAGGRITYGDLANYLSVHPLQVGKYLTPIYNALTRYRSLPHLPLVVVYKGTNYGRYNSEGGPAESIEVDAGDPEQIQRYEADLAQVYDFDWSAVDLSEIDWNLAH